MQIKIAKSENEYKECFEFIRKMWNEEFEIDFELNIDENYKNFINSEVYYIKEKSCLISVIQLAKINKGFQFKDGTVAKKNYYFLWRIGVSKNYRKKGYGSKLINYSIESIKNKGFKLISLYSEIKNIEYYSKFGFKKIRNKEKTIGNTITIYMEKEL